MVPHYLPVQVNHVKIIPFEGGTNLTDTIDQVRIVFVNFYGAPCNTRSFLRHTMGWFFSVGFPGWESNPGYWDGNTAHNLLDHPDSP